MAKRIHRVSRETLPPAVKGGEKMYRVGGSTGVFGRLKTLPPGAFHMSMTSESVLTNWPA